MQNRIGEILLAHQSTDANMVERALALQQGEKHELLGEILLRLGGVTPARLAAAVAQQFNLEIAQGTDYPDFPVHELLLATRFLRENQAIPLGERNGLLAVAMVHPQRQAAREAIEFATGQRVLPLATSVADFEAAFERLYGGGRSVMGQIVDDLQTIDAETLDSDVQHLKDLASEAPVIRLVGLIIRRAIEARASDIHIEPFENRLAVRYRIDGVLHEAESPPRRLAAAVISRVKIMANLDIAERRLPQDGRIRLRLQGNELDLRVSTTPTMHGESVVMRILDKGGIALDFTALGFESDLQQRFANLLFRPHGILLVTGPTGSGKTTTLYTALSQLNKPDVKILTVEDPVEYQLEGINQIQVKPQIELTFANALRSIVRQDPDVIMIGEIRDLETAQIAVQSALTGHLVLSTLHTNDAASTINRLLDMGVEDYLLTTTIIGIQAQRLVRMLCPECRRPQAALPELLVQSGLSRFITPGAEIMLYEPVGCDQCAHTGFVGRVAIMEIMPINDPIRRLVMNHAVTSEISTQAQADGMLTMYEHGLRKVLAGVTTLDEVLRVTREA